MKKQHFDRGMIFGKWKLVDFIDAGGNGEVWKVVDDQQNESAIKILTRIGLKAYSRFCDEIKIVESQSDIKGILPILEYYLPKK
jgi:hypothetical protein